MKALLSTHNRSKTEQIRAIFAGSSIEIISLDDVKILGKASEDGTTLEQNAALKALFAWDGLSDKLWTMADDTGLFISALGGRPGVHAARWAGENATTKEITLHTLKELNGASDRSAKFETCVYLVSPEGKKYSFNGEVWGIILTEPRCEPQPDMPYSPIFVPIGSDKVWAEMTVEEENAISHRGIAFREARKFLELQLSVAA